MNIKGGALEFDIIANNGQLNSALEESKKRVQGFSNATVAGGEQMEAAFKDAAETIDKAFADIDAMANIHKAALSRLETDYAKLGEAAAAAFMKGTAKGDEEYRALSKKQTALKQEITTRKGLLKEIGATADALAQEEQALKKNYEETEKNTKAQISLRTQLRKTIEELANMEQAGQRGSDAYKALQLDAGRLTDALGDAQKQARILAHDQAGFQGIISALSVATGAAAVAQGTISLFAGEYENLNKVMLKVQSLMAITIGLQQVKAELDKDSAFRVKTLGDLKKWWTGVLEKSNATQKAETVTTITSSVVKQGQTTALTQNSAAQAGNAAATVTQTTAAKAGTTANLGLAGAFRVLGAAIKSIPVFGWIAVGITAIVSVFSHFSNKARDARKAAQEFTNAVSEMAGKPISAINELSHAWDKLGSDLQAKQKFIEDNADKFKELGVAIRDVEDAENLLVKSKGKFIEAEIEKAKAIMYRAHTAELAQKAAVIDMQMTDVLNSLLPEKIKTKMLVKLENDRKEIVAKIGSENDKLIEANEKAAGLLSESGIKATNDAVKEYEAGTVGALEKLIAEKQDKLKELSDPEAYREGLKEIKKLKAELAAITGEGKKNEDRTVDPFVEKLEQRRKKYQEYFQWVNAGLQSEAKVEFADLQDDGTNYLDFLKKQRKEIEEEIEKTGKASALQTKNLYELNSRIAAETKETVLAQFEGELQAQLGSARSVLEMLNIIEERRKTLSGDGSEMDNNKARILDNAQQDIAKQAETELAQATQAYKDYIDNKVDADVRYFNKKKELEEQLAKETSESNKKIIEDQLNALTTTYDLGQAMDYEKLVEQYRNYSQRRADISAEYDKKIAIAAEQNDKELIDRLQQAKYEALSSVAAEELQNSDAWEQLFGNLDELTARQISVLVDEIETQFDSLAGIFNPVDLNTIRTKLNEAKAILINDNPFKQLGVALRAVFNDAGDDSKDTAAKIKKNWKELANATEKSFNFVSDAVSSCQFLKEAIGDVGATAISSMATVAVVSIAVAEAIKTAERASVVLAIIQAALAVVQAVANVFKSMFGNQDKKIEKSIKKHAEAVKELERAYNALSWAIDKALGETVYKDQKALINNMKEQQAHMKAMWEAEESKKKTDKNKVAEFKSQYEALARQIEDTIAEIAASITQTTAKDLANDLADAIVDAFSKGEDSAEAFEKTAEKVMQNAVKNALKLQYLEIPLQDAIKRLQKDMGFDSLGNGSFDGLTAAEQQRFKNEIARIGSNFSGALKMYDDLFKELEDTSDPSTTLAGAIKGASQESIDLLAGQTNAVRVNQMEGIDIMRNQLLHLTSIDAKVGVSNAYLAQIANNTDKHTSDPLRAKGITI